MRIFNNYCFLTVFLAVAALADPIVQVNPAPLTGNNGVFGWGFSLTNDTASFLSVDSVQLAGPVDDPLFRFGPAGNFTELFASFQFLSPNILIAPNSTYALAYNGSDQGLAAWAFPDGFGTYGNLASNVFQIQIGYSLYDDNAYASFAGSGTANADAQLQFAPATVPEPATWVLLASVLGLMGMRRRVSAAFGPGDAYPLVPKSGGKRLLSYRRGVYRNGTNAEQSVERSDTAVQPVYSWGN